MFRGHILLMLVKGNRPIWTRPTRFSLEGMRSQILRSRRISWHSLFSNTNLPSPTFFTSTGVAGVSRRTTRTTRSVKDAENVNARPSSRLITCSGPASTSLPRSPRPLRPEPTLIPRLHPTRIKMTRLMADAGEVDGYNDRNQLSPATLTGGTLQPRRAVIPVSEQVQRLKQIQ